jgi:PPP family 3-phenylpropionic acid transporter
VNKQLWIVRWLIASYYGTSGMLTPFLPLYFSNKGFTPIQIGLFMMLGPFTAIFAQPVWGYISDRLKTVKNIIAILWVLTVGSSVLLFLSEGFALTLLAVTMLYFFMVPSSPLLDVISIQAATQARTSYGSIRLWGSASFAVIAVVAGSILISIGGITHLQWLYWGIWLIPLTLLLFLKDTVQQSAAIRLHSLVHVIRNRSFLWFLLLIFIMMIPHRMNDTYLVLFMNERGASEQMAGLAWALAAVSEIPVFALLHRYIGRFHELALLGIVGLLYGLRWILAAFTMDPLMLLIMQASHSITFAVFWITSIAYVVRLVPTELRSTGLSIFSAVFIGLSGISGSLFGGWLEAKAGFMTAYLAGALLAAVAGIAFLVTHAMRARIS